MTHRRARTDRRNRPRWKMRRYDHEINVCMDLACASQGSDKLKRCARKGRRGLRQKGLRPPHRLHGTLLRRPAGPRRSRRNPLPPCRMPSTPRPLSPAWAASPCPSCSAICSEHFDKQVRVVLENSGHIDPEKIDDYIARDGYKALLTALTEMTPNGVIQQHHRERPARARRRRLSHRPEVGHGGQSRRRPEVRHLQRRRRRPRRVHGSQRPGKRSASRALKAWPSPPMRSAQARATSTSAPNIRWPSRGSPPPARGAAPRPARQQHLQHAVQLRR